jgi:hypothetical protein
MEGLVRNRVGNERDDQISLNSGGVVHFNILKGTMDFSDRVRRGQCAQAVFEGESNGPGIDSPGEAANEGATSDTVRVGARLGPACEE